MDIDRVWTKIVIWGLLLIFSPMAGIIESFIFVFFVLDGFISEKEWGKFKVKLRTEAGGQYSQ